MAADRSYKSTPRTRKGALTSFGSRTDIGCLRDHNEDSLVVTPPLFAVADGMGGHAAGEVASEIAVRVLSELAPEHPDGEALGRAIEEANRAVIQAAHEGRGRQGMGTTMTAAMLEGERLVIAQVGDSRAYLLHQGKLQQLTRDHSLMADMIEAGQLTPEEARTHPQRSVITRALGSDVHLHPDIYEINVETGDRLLVCSDGLSGMVFDDQIESTLRRVQDPQRCASQLVNEAIAAGGHDNVTVIVADVTGYAEVRRKKLARKTKLSIALVLVLFAAIVAGAAWGTQTYLNTAAYLANDNGKVAVYRGVPGSVLGLSFSHLERTTDVTVADLQPGVANRLNEGIRVDDMEAADALVKEYEDEIAARSKNQAEGGNAESGRNADAKDASDAKNGGAA
ncbi:Stp1/IreP family PP2C-type Ser/Thr phosphatase [Eggerthella lenta]|uniref:Stp1/IreP family PP2C-type Ser/Thr phosphatase n=1 Tax=Eggerthella lenta TaxID=84112 RepID=UPI000DF821FC|nr:Stp1/IreP family PP2C-type Ser/Thr phosphatase [Eggerthella lenta]MDB1775364.1 Stp1/IreP family PP2C-type Ser/Thr phosphatase [Eggerthella lenta]MDB1799530.1 Stp1/IreP family PP2C-type Ser/Thr phosphatase [Eggerthella lenta]RDC04785.1 protein phosphatase [Eggerthella lenta]